MTQEVRQESSDAKKLRKRIQDSDGGTNKEDSVAHQWGHAD